MALILFKWLFVFFLAPSPKDHPVYMSITEIDHNAKERTLEISCKIFTDDFEQALRKISNKKIDLIDVKKKVEMNGLVKDYLKKHLMVSVNGRPVSFTFLGFEQQEEGIISFLQADNVTGIKEIIVTNNILYEYKPQQISLLHVTVNDTRKSSKLDNPVEKAVFTF
ncbi:MAG: DUF6702 family protein [Ferruginibacter sp.]